ncbi:MAG: replicative DNA helicase [Parcubacteria group bacterium Athens1014_10]|nr:MAG: replicative DNA helicase [Parcubacteria group bacterium Athens1014_10]
MPQNSIEKLPPQNIEAEQSVLGSLLIDKEAIVKIADIIKPDDFYKDINRIIFESMLSLYEKREPIDVLSLANILEEKNQLELIGGRSYLATLANSVPTSAHIINYAQIVQKKATLRRLIQTAGDINQLAYHESEDTQILLDIAEQKIFGISQRYLKRSFTSIKEILGGTFERIDDLNKEGGGLRGLSTGFNDLDNMLAGFQKSDLIILASRPSAGKTSLALNFARNIAVKNKKIVGIFSLEMSKEQLVDRLICSEAGIDLWKMRTGKLSHREDSNDFTHLGKAFGVLGETLIYIDDSPSATILEISTKARRLKSEHGLDFIVIDYLQLMQGRASIENRVLEVAEISRGLKAIARELDIPVLALSQLSRAVESRHPPIPKLSDLRESGSIEQDSDVVMFIYREAMYKKDTPRRHIADIHIAKHRNGPTGTIELYFDENQVAFKNLEKKEDEIEF